MDKKDQEYLVEKIKSRYIEKEYTELDELKALDRKVKTPATVFAYVFGSLDYGRRDEPYYDGYRCDRRCVKCKPCWADSRNSGIDDGCCGLSYI